MLKSFRLSLVLFSTLVLAAGHFLGPNTVASPPAFPGAEGFGAQAMGARAVSNPTVYRVTNLNNSGPGSFRDAVSEPGRFIIFDVGGIIEIRSPIAVSANLTIAGQTAPGEGITIYGHRVSFSNAHNTICRYIRFRMGIAGPAGGDSVGIAHGRDMIFDHVSASWGRDENFSINGNNAIRITLQDCLIAQGLRVHSAGGLMQTSGGVSIFRTLYADNWMRNPKVKGVNDFINNVVYNWGSGGGYYPAGDSAGRSYANLIGNYFIAGPGTGADVSPFLTGNENYHLYHADNRKDLDLDGALNGVAVTDESFSTLTLVNERHPYPAPTLELSPDEALAWIIDHAGASLHRDRTDDYVIDELLSFGTRGAFIFDESEMGGIGTLAGGLAPVDSDGDGMPDWWEEAAGTNPDLPDAMEIGPDGYTNLERYLNAIAIGGVPGAMIAGISEDTGSSATDGVTSARNLTLHGTGRPGANIEISRVDLGPIGSVTANADGEWVFDYSNTTLPDRFYAFQATATVDDILTPASPAFVVRVDTAPAEAPRIASIALSPDLTVKGTALPGDTIHIQLEGNQVGSATANELGNWNARYTGTELPPGTHTFHATATSLAGNSGPSSEPYVVDTSIGAPRLTGIVHDTGHSDSDLLTNDTTLVLNGAAPAGSVVTVTRTGIGTIGSVNADSSGAFSFDYTEIDLPEGVHSFTATASLGSVSSPASEALVVTIDTTAPTVTSIRRYQPATYSTNGGEVTFRVTFDKPVTGVDLSDFSLTQSGTEGRLTECVPVSETVYDLIVADVSGDGTIRANLRNRDSGIVDFAGNPINGGFNAGENYTVRLPGSGVWFSTDSGGLWSDPLNWDGELIADGDGATADFSLRDITEPTLVHLNSPRTLSRLVLGNLDHETPAGWTLGHNGDPANTLTLSGTNPTIQVDAATTPFGDTQDVPTAAAHPAKLDLSLISPQGFTKTGVGTLEFTQPNPGITGPLNITRGIVQVGPGGSLSPASVSIATSQQLRVTGGDFSTDGDVTWNSGTGTGIIVSAGSANFRRIMPSNFRNSFVRITDGTFSATEINFLRNGDSEVQALNSGLLISGGESVIGAVGLGTGDSWGHMGVSGGKVTVTGPVHVGYQRSSRRGGVVVVSGGELNVLDSQHGLILARNPGQNANNIARLTITAGVANLNRITLGYDSSVTDGSGTVELDGGELNLGGGGIIKNGAAGMETSIILTSGVLGATAPWTTTHPLILHGPASSLSIRAGTSTEEAHDIILDGALSGEGGFTKTGAGTVTLAADNQFTGDVQIAAGTLIVTGSIAAGEEVAIHEGGRLAASGTIERDVILHQGGALAPTGALTVRSLDWRPGGKITRRLGEGSLTVSGSLANGGGTGPRVFELIADQPLSIGDTFTLITFAGTNLTADNFAHTSLDGAEGRIEVSGNSVTFRVTALGNNGQ